MEKTKGNFVWNLELGTEPGLYWARDVQGIRRHLIQVFEKDGELWVGYAMHRQGVEQRYDAFVSVTQGHMAFGDCDMAVPAV